MQAGGKKSRDTLILAGVILAVVALVAGVGFYQEEVMAFFRFHGWNLAPVSDATRTFLAAAAKGDGDKVASMIATDAPTLKVVRSGGRVTGVELPAYGGPHAVPLKTLAPSADATIGSPHIVSLNGGFVTVEATYPRSILKLSWVPVAGDWKMREMEMTAR